MSKNIARIVNGRIVYIDEHAPTLHPNETAARASREDQRVRYRAEMLQPNQVDYYKVYPEQAQNLSPELRRMLS